MSRTERENARLRRKLTIGGFDFYALSDNSDSHTVTDLMLPAGTTVRYVESR